MRERNYVPHVMQALDSCTMPLDASCGCLLPAAINAINARGCPKCRHVHQASC
jgi:hypothetical protein